MIESAFLYERELADEGRFSSFEAFSLVMWADDDVIPKGLSREEYQEALELAWDELTSEPRAWEE